MKIIILNVFPLLMTDLTVEFQYFLETCCTTVKTEYSTKI